MYANLESFSNQCSYYVSNFSFFKSSLPLLSFFIYIKNLFVVTIFFPFYLIKHRPRKVYLKAPRGRSNIRRTQRSPRHLGNRRAFGHLRHSGNRAFRGLRALGNWGTQTIRTFRLSGSQATWTLSLLKTFIQPAQLSKGKYLFRFLLGLTYNTIHLLCQGIQALVQLTIWHNDLDK